MVVSLCLSKIRQSLHLWHYVIYTVWFKKKNPISPFAQSSEETHSGANTYEIPSTVECLSVQTYSFKSTEGELATMICLSLLQASVKKWGAGGEEKKTLGKCSSSIGAIYYVPQKKTHSTNDEKPWLGDLGRPGRPHSSVPVITRRAFWHLTWVKDSPGEKAESQILTKATFWGQQDASWESGELSITRKFSERTQRPHSGTLPDVAKCKSYVVLPNIRE